MTQDLFFEILGSVVMLCIALACLKLVQLYIGDTRRATNRTERWGSAACAVLTATAACSLLIAFALMIGACLKIGWHP